MKTSALKPTPVYPGRLDVEEDWIPAERIQRKQVVRTEADTEEFVLWAWPPARCDKSGWPPRGPAPPPARGTRVPCKGRDLPVGRQFPLAVGKIPGGGLAATTRRPRL